METWVYASENVRNGESHYDVLRNRGKMGWEAWHIEITIGWREIFFKKKSTTQPDTEVRG